MRGGTFQLWGLVLLCACAGRAQALEETQCRIGLEGSPKVLARCATLEVAANPDAPGGEKLKLSVARIPALAATTLPDPIVLIQGGPGGSSIDLYLTMRGALTGLRRNRDIIVMDQRGTGRSKDGMACSAPDDVDFQTADAEVLRGLLDRCLENLQRDPRFYTTSLAVRDLETLREAYGVERWNLYGVSYGTRVAQHYLRHFPNRVRTAILDGSVPASLVLGPHIARATQDALDAILARCAHDDRCAERFGDVGRKFHDVLARVQSQNIRVSRLDRTTGRTDETRLRADMLLGLTRMMSYSSATAALLPLTLDEAYAGHYGALLDQVDLVLGNVENAMNFAMHNTVICSEDWPRLDPDAPPIGAGTYLGELLVESLGVICRNWPIGPVDADFSEPLVTDVPVLFMSGGADPATPARFVDDIIAGGVRNSKHVVVNNQGHGVFSIGCMPRIAEAFIDAASVTDLQTDCIEDVLPTPFFLSPAGPAP